MLRTFYCDVLRVVLQFTAKQCFSQCSLYTFSLVDGSKEEVSIILKNISIVFRCRPVASPLVMGGRFPQILHLFRV